ncbi:hypothetical protein G2W53_020191 [Senna tora]|uniref:Uncharacterized protein n=1 Tax=Senna tora TaxID=362788 RepID=A0A834WNA4_9FABA|nr:hypothetical protein G2W53_020191 [Senna tora]
MHVKAIIVIGREIESVQVVAIGESQEITVSLIKANPISDLVDLPFLTLQSTVDDVGDHTVPAEVSAAEGVHVLVMTSWEEGLLPCGVIQNQTAVLNDITASVATRSGLLIKSTPMAFPA